MDFLRKHYEKVIFTLFLLLFLGWCLFLWRTFVRVDTTLKKMVWGIGVNPAGTKPLEPVSRESFNGLDALVDPRVEWLMRGDPSIGTLFDPARYIRCRNSECFYLLPYDTKQCPFCSTDAGVTTSVGGPSKDLDSDGDGIPDHVEKQYAFLDPQESRDAQFDEDADLFSNLDEYRAGTKLDDPTSHPPFARKLRLVRAMQTPLPILFVKMTRTGDDQAKWTFQFTVVEGNRTVTRFARLGERVGPYTLLSVTPKSTKVWEPATKSQREVDVSEVTIEQTGEAPVTLVREKPAYQKNESVRFIFLTDSSNPNACPQPEVLVGQEFVLNVGKELRETYVLVAVGEREAIVRRAGDEAGVEFRVPRVNPELDFQQAVPAEGTPEGMPPGMMGPWGPMPMAPQPGRR